MEDSLQNRWALPLVIISIVMAIAFGGLWMRDRHRVQTIRLSTAGKNGQYYAFAKAFAQVVARHQPNIKIQVQESEGSVQNEQLVQERKVDLALVQSDTLLSPSTKVVSFLFPEMFHLIATKPSGIHHVSDLRGKRIALMPEGSGSYALFWALSHHYGLTETDFQHRSVPFDEANQILLAGKVDALFRVTALRDPSMSQLLQQPNIRLVPIAQGAALRLTLPALEDSQIPKGAYNGAIPIPEEDIPGVAVRALLVAHQDLSPKLVHQLTQILFEARNELVKYHPPSASISQPELKTALGFSYHSGAKSFFERGKPSFIVEYAEPLGLLLSVMALGISGIWQFRLWFKGKQKNLADYYNLEIVKLTETIAQCSEREELNQVRKQLFTIFEQVIIDLDEDRISHESFQSFTFTWEVAIATIRHRELLLTTESYANTPE